MGSCWHLRQSGQRAQQRSPSKGSDHVSPSRSGGDRPWRVAFGGGVQPRTPCTDFKLHATQGAGSNGTAVHPSDRPSLDRGLCREAEGSRRLPRASQETLWEVTGCSNQQSRWCSKSCSERRTQRKGKERVQPGRERHGVMVSDMSMDSAALSNADSHCPSLGPSSGSCPDDVSEPIPRPPLDNINYETYEQHFADNFGLDSLPFAEGHEELVVGRNVPGARASTLRIHSLWRSCCRLIFKSGGAFSSFLWCMINKPGPTKPSPTACCWPMPLPFFHCFQKRVTSDEPKDKAFKIAVALQIAFLNWLHLGKPGLAPVEICGLQHLSDEQELVVERFGKLASAWNDHPEIEASDLGRTAAKQESIESMLLRISSMAEDKVATLGGYSKRKTSGKQPRPTSMHAHKIGQLSNNNISGAQEIIASRIKMAGTPSFDPIPFLDDEIGDLYLHPLKHACDPSVAPNLPRVRVHASFDEKLSLLELLQTTGRLAFRAPSEIIDGFGNGLFTVVKDLSVDRLILDARPANCLQTAPQKYIMSMGSAASLTQIILRDHEKLLFSGDDLSNYFYTFQASHERVSRNFLDWKIPTEVVRHMSSFPSRLRNERYVYACLGSLAMGDSAACEYAQASHLSLGLQSGAFMPGNLITMHGRIPRGRFLCGIGIDDLILAEKVALQATYGECLDSSRKTMLDMYASVGLDAHPAKGFANLEQTSFWGADIDGVVLSGHLCSRFFKLGRRSG